MCNTEAEAPSGQGRSRVACCFECAAKELALGPCRLLQDSTLLEICKRHGRRPAGVLVRWSFRSPRATPAAASAGSLLCATPLG